MITTKIILTILLIILVFEFFKTMYPYTPKVGDRIKVAVGFSTYLNEGVVTRICEDSDGGNYCWVNQFYPNGGYKSSFTASFSYCKFIKIN